MARNIDQKIRLLALYDLLQSKTDEENPMSTQEIISALAERGISVSRKTLYQDIDLLNRHGYEVVCVRGRSNRYFVGDRKFERPEVQMLLSAVGATQSLSDKKTAILVRKLLELLGGTAAEKLYGIVPNSAIKHSNERVYYSIDAITTAIIEKKKLSLRLRRYLKAEVRSTREKPILPTRQRGQHFLAVIFSALIAERRCTLLLIPILLSSRMAQERCIRV